MKHLTREEFQPSHVSSVNSYVRSVTAGDFFKLIILYGLRMMSQISKYPLAENISSSLFLKKAYAFLTRVEWLEELLLPWKYYNDTFLFLISFEYIRWGKEYATPKYSILVFEKIAEARDYPLSSSYKKGVIATQKATLSPCSTYVFEANQKVLTWQEIFCLGTYTTNSAWPVFSTFLSIFGS